MVETNMTERGNSFHWHTAIFVGLFHLGAAGSIGCDAAPIRRLVICNVGDFLPGRL
jgi:hypothetical protein